MSSAAATAGAVAATPRRPSTLTVYRWEVRKLLAQKRTYIGIGAAALLPVVFVTVMALQRGGPYDAPLGHNLRRTGIPLTLVVLTFASRFGAQLVTALVAGDIVANEDSTGTLKALFTRSARRDQILAGKVLATFTYVGALLLAILTTGMIAGISAWGFHPVVSLSGVRLSAAHAFGLTFAALGVYAVPLLAVAAFGIFLSAVTRNSAAAIVGTLMVSLLIQLVGILPGLGGLHPYLLSTQFNAWQGLLRQPVDWAPVIRSAWVCSLYGLPSLAAAYLVFLRRDVAGG